MRFPRQEYYSGLPFPSSGDLPYPGIELKSPALAEGSLPLNQQGSHMIQHTIQQFIDIYSRNLKIHVYKNTHTQIFMAILFKLAYKWKQPKYP